MISQLAKPSLALLPFVRGLKVFGCIGNFFPGSILAILVTETWQAVLNTLLLVIGHLFGFVGDQLKTDNPTKIPEIQNVASSVMNSL